MEIKKEIANIEGRSLYSLFSEDEYTCKKEYTRRFNSPDAIHLKFDIGDYPAFLYMNSSIYKLLVSIERTDKEVNALCGNLPGVALDQLINKSLIGEIFQTNSIEGVISTRKDISQVLSDIEKVNTNKRFYGLVKKYRILSKNENIKIKTCEDIRQIYDDMFGYEIKAEPENLPDGKIFRKGPVSVYDRGEKEIHYGLFPEERIIFSMERALDFLENDKVDFLVRIAVFHYLFGYIHPFYDGNGRTSRFISSCLLSENLNRLTSFRLSYTIKENISKYYKAFKICNDFKRNMGDLTPFVEMFLTVINTAEENLAENLIIKQGELEKYKKLINTLPKSDDKKIWELYFLFIQAALFSENGISTKEILDSSDISQYIFKKKLEEIPSEYLKIQRVGKNNCYMLNLDKL